MRHLIHPEWLRNDWRDVCEFIATAAIAANFLPRAAKFQRWPKLYSTYTWLVDVVALFACNWRANLPSLDEEFLGFQAKCTDWLKRRRRRKKHGLNGNHLRRRRRR